MKIYKRSRKLFERMSTQFGKRKEKRDCLATLIYHESAGEAPGRASPEWLVVDRPLYHWLAAIDKIDAQDVGAGVN